MEIQTHQLLVDLDALFDTRLGTIYQHYDDKAFEILTDHYHDRVVDHFKGIDYDEFKQKYKQRDKQTLALSTTTEIMQVIKDYCRGCYGLNHSTPLINRPKLIINTYPYLLTVEEGNILKTGLIIKTSKLMEIELTHKTPLEITPSYLKTMNSYFTYDPYLWLDVHSQADTFKKESCPDVTMCGPLMFKSKDQKGVTLKELFIAMDQLVKPFIDMQFFDVKMFSTLIKQNK